MNIPLQNHIPNYNEGNQPRSSLINISLDHPNIRVTDMVPKVIFGGIWQNVELLPIYTSRFLVKQSQVVDSLFKAVFFIETYSKLIFASLLIV